jgi:hypothetical protein
MLRCPALPPWGVVGCGYEDHIAVPRGMRRGAYALVVSFGTDAERPGVGVRRQRDENKQASGAKPEGRAGADSSDGVQRLTP